MPELPEVETTTRGLKKEITGLKILDIWTDLNTKDKRKFDTISNPSYFISFKKELKNKTILSVERRAKNILINLSGNSKKGIPNKTILIHLKMTGHLLYGKYVFIKKENKWEINQKGPLNDPYNRFVHVVFSLSNNKCLAFSDARKFGKITLMETNSTNNRHLINIGPEPLGNHFDFNKFKTRLTKKPNGKIKTVLMDQSIVAGIGNIYSDEILWHSNIHPNRKILNLNDKELKIIFVTIKKILNKGIYFGGDSMSDYRNIYGLPGKFQLHHMAYRRIGEKCKKKNCKGVIMRQIINSRSAHYCSQHQI
jgi:formamidopyrimidine-DNA glycosylase